MPEFEGRGPEDWGVANYVGDDRVDSRWASLLGLLSIRGLITWVTGKDPVLERRRQQLAEEQIANARRYEDLEQEAYQHLHDGEPRERLERKER